jgi:hypothetical protein
MKRSARRHRKSRLWSKLCKHSTALRKTTAATIVSELGSLSRLQSPHQLIGYSGLVAARAEEPGPQRWSQKDGLEAQQRLHKRYQGLAARGKDKNQIATALKRELLGLILAIARQHRTTTEIGKAA